MNESHQHSSSAEYPTGRIELEESAPQSGKEDAVLSQDEELFVSAFVDYWLRRGALIVGDDQ